VTTARLTTVVPYGIDGSSARVRMYDWLEQTGVPADIHSYLGQSDNSPRTLLTHATGIVSAERSLRRLSKTHPDLLFLQREASPLSSGALERSLLRSSRFGVYDFDDSLQWDEGGGLLRRFASKPAKCRAAVATADRVIAGNEILADWASTIARDVVVIPSCVEPETYRAKENYELGDPPRIVWLGSPSTEHYVLARSRALREVHQRTGARLVIISGSDRPPDGLRDMCDAIRWDLGSVLGGLASYDIGISPLPDSPWTRGKCAYKLLQYGAAGLPVVGSPVGANTPVLQMLNGEVATSDDEWVEQLVGLVGASSTIREAMGRAARRAVESAFSFGVWEERWLRAVGLLDG
jgi:glycosyltransferase involved in cell wall biosynthesis